MSTMDEDDPIEDLSRALADLAGEWSPEWQAVVDDPYGDEEHDMSTLPEPKTCVLCGKPAITTAAHIPVCEEHWNEYDREGRNTNPYTPNRPFYQSLLRAEGARLLEVDFHYQLLNQGSDE